MDKTHLEDEVHDSATLNPPYERTANSQKILVYSDQSRLRQIFRFSRAGELILRQAPQM